MHTRTLIAAAAIAAAGLIAPATAQGIEAAGPSPAPDTSIAAPAWAPESSATIHPGAQTSSPSGSCTANFVFYTSTDIFLGSAAHCTTTSGSTTANGCEAGSLPLGTKVTVQGASRQAELVYNSWLTMQSVGESNANICNFNDFALLKLDPADHTKVNPTVPFWGGPDDIGSSTPVGSDVYANGNSGLRLGISVLQPKVGLSLGDVGDGWAHRAYFATPGIPGDSGGAVMNSSGYAVGMFHTVIIAPYAGANDASDLAKAIAYMKAHTSAHDSLLMGRGTRGFQPLA